MIASSQAEIQEIQISKPLQTPKESKNNFDFAGFLSYETFIRGLLPRTRHKAKSARAKLTLNSESKHYEVIFRGYLSRTRHEPAKSSKRVCQ